jgi:deoxyribodipyrimidine photo-lyase
MTTIVWFRQDLRLEDNPALAAAAAAGPVVPVYIWAPHEEGAWPPGAASRWWLHRSLAALDERLRAAGSRLIVRRGDSLAVLAGLQRELGGAGVVWNRRYEPAAIARDADVKRALAGRSYRASLLHEPWTVTSRSGGPFQVFTPFWRRLLELGEPDAPAPAPQLTPPPAWPESLPLVDLGLLPDRDWAAGFDDVWTPGERGAAAELDRFAAHAAGYADVRDLPAHAGSRLSPHLHLGEIGPRQVWATVRLAAGAAAEPYLRQLGWREFANHLLYHHPDLPERPLRTAFERFPWRQAPADLAAWQRGRTGYPLVDAGMHELWRTGFMHNRVRMVAASFLTKHLLIDWREGARWFWDTLVDADLANNTMGWQWVAGSGADAAPYFRIFNPATQAGRYDADGGYRRRWLAGTPTLPPLVEHAAARERALAAYATIRSR